MPHQQPHPFQIVVRDASGVIASYTSLSNSAAAAEGAARDRYDIPVGISVRPA